MRKFLAVVKHEYKKVVLKWSFLIGTLLLPFLAACFAVIPALIFSMQGEATRIAIVDPTGGIGHRLRENLSAEKMAARAQKAAAEALKNIDASQQEKMRQNSRQFAESFVFVDYPNDADKAAGVRQDLTSKILNGEIDAYLIVPQDINAADAAFEFRSRRASDIVSNETLKDALNSAVRSQRLADANISEAQLEKLSADVNIDVKGVNERGEEKDTEGIMVA